MKLSIRLLMFVITIVVVSWVAYFLGMNYFIPWVLNQDSDIFTISIIGVFICGIVLLVAIFELIGKVFKCDDLIDKFMK